MEGSPIKKCSKAFACSFLRSIMQTHDIVKLKLKILRELGFTEDDVRILVKRWPEFLWSSKDKIMHNLKFLV